MKKWFLIAFGCGLGVTMAVLCARQMPVDALAVIVGVSVGIVASVPASFLVVALIRREGGTKPEVLQYVVTMRKTRAVASPEQLTTVKHVVPDEVWHP